MTRSHTKLFIAVLCMFTPMFMQSQPAAPGSQGRGKLAIFFLPPFERAVRCIKYYEGWHSEKEYPYIGYGHCLRPGEKLTSNITAHQADSLLRSDLKECCRIFRRYGKDSLLLATLGYNVGPFKILGNERYPKSNLLTQIENGNRDILEEYVNFSHWRGKSIASIRRRRMTEFKLLFEK